MFGSNNRFPHFHEVSYWIIRNLSLGVKVVIDRRDCTSQKSVKYAALNLNSCIFVAHRKPKKKRFPWPSLIFPVKPPKSSEDFWNPGPIRSHDRIWSALNGTELCQNSIILSYVLYKYIIYLYILHYILYIIYTLYKLYRYIISLYIYIITCFSSALEMISRRSCSNSKQNTYVPIGSMYGIYANIWGILMVNVAIYSVHGSYGICIYIYRCIYIYTYYI